MPVGDAIAIIQLVIQNKNLISDDRTLTAGVHASDEKIFHEVFSFFTNFSKEALINLFAGREQGLKDANKLRKRR